MKDKTKENIIINGIPTIILIVLVAFFGWCFYYIHQQEAERNKQIHAQKWLVITGNTHWVLTKGGHKMRENPMCYRFIDNHGNNVTIDGMATVIRIREDIDTFLKTYKERYGL